MVITSIRRRLKSTTFRLDCSVWNMLTCNIPRLFDNHRNCIALRVANLSMFNGTVRHLFGTKASRNTQTVDKLSNQQREVSRSLVMVEN